MPVFKFKGVDFIEIDGLLTQEERLVRDTTRRFVEDNVVPIIEQCNREGRFPTGRRRYGLPRSTRADPKQRIDVTRRWRRNHQSIHAILSLCSMKECGRCRRHHRRPGSWLPTERKFGDRSYRTAAEWPEWATVVIGR